MTKAFNEGKSQGNVLDRSVVATHLIRPMRGRCRSVLLLADDSQLYIVKFANNPSGPNVLANEVLGEVLCKAFDLPVANGALVYVPPFLLTHTNRIWPDLASSSFRPVSGVHYGARYIGALDGSVQLYDMMPQSLLGRVINRADFLGMLIVDIWANHQDSRQSVFEVDRSSHATTATFIDHSDLFGGPQNLFDEVRCKALYQSPAIYLGLLDVQMVEEWKRRIRDIAPAILLESFEYVPRNWFNDNHNLVRIKLLERLQELDRLVEPLLSLLRRFEF